MGALKGSSCYLSGPIQFEDTSKPDWRPRVVKELTERFGINVFDPAADEKQKRAKLLEVALAEDDFDKAEEIATSFCKKDLAEIDRTDFLVACHPHGISSIGVPCEIHHAVQLKKPVVIICPEGKRHAGRWYFGNIRHKYIFGNWGDCYSYLQEVDDKKHTDNHRWWYVYKMV